VAAEAADWEAEATVLAAAAVEEEQDDEDEEEDGDIAWSDDELDPEEQAAHQRAIVESFESQKKLHDNARALEEENDARVRGGVELSLQQEEQRRGGDDAAGHRLLITLRRERWRAANEQRRRGGERRGTSNALPGGQ
jgi:hypothetical protein